LPSQAAIAIGSIGYGYRSVPIPSGFQCSEACAA